MKLIRKGKLENFDKFLRKPIAFNILLLISLITPYFGHLTPFLIPYKPLYWHINFFNHILNLKKCKLSHFWPSQLL